MSARPLLAELVGTFVLVLVAAASGIAAAATGGGPLLAGVATGLALAGLIAALGPVSGAHLNPAVTLALLALRRIGPRTAAGYCLAQATGALLGAALVRGSYPEGTILAHGATTLGGSVPTGGAFVLEVVITAALVLIVLAVAVWETTPVALVGLLVGGWVAGAIAAFGPITGGSMNPARSLGPALVFSARADLWLYLTAPFLGALVAVVLARGLFGRERALVPA